MTIVKEILRIIALTFLFSVLLTAVIIGNPNDILKAHHIIRHICGWGGIIITSLFWWFFWV